MSLTTMQPKAITPAKLEAELTKLNEGAQTQLAAGTVLTIGGAPLNQAALGTKLQAWIAAFKAVATAQQAYQEALAARLAITVEARTFAKLMKGVVKGHFGPQSAALASFGIPSDHPVSITTQQKLVASAKRTQTRQARGTKGKKQQAAITVVGNPAVHVASDGSVQISPPPVNLPAADSTSGSTGNGTPTGGSTPSKV
jgi:hypothetical protein